LAVLRGHLDRDHLVGDMDILNDIRAEEEPATPFEAARDRANMFAVSLFLAHSMNECIKHHMAGEEDGTEFAQKMHLAAKTLDAMNVSA
jgi:hypothetical protein